MVNEKNRDDKKSRSEQLAKFQKKRRADIRRQREILREPEPIGEIYDTIRVAARRDADGEQRRLLHSRLMLQAGSFNLRHARRSFASLLISNTDDTFVLGRDLLRGVPRVEAARRVRVYVRSRHA